MLAREALAIPSLRVLLAGRDFGAARKACRLLDDRGRCEPFRLDLDDREAVRRAAAGCFAIVCAAGPFQKLDRMLPRLVREAGAHWLDIADDESWVLSLLQDQDSDGAPRPSAPAILPGLSTVPTLSGALVRWCLQKVPAIAAPRARIVLWIGNRNRKGAAAIASALRSGFRRPVTVRLPVGDFQAWLFRSPDRELLARDPGIEAEFRVGFEWSITNRLAARLQAVPDGLLQPLAECLAILSAPLCRLGSDAACLQAEILDGRGRRSIAAPFIARGQRLAVLPAAIALESLAAGDPGLRGMVVPGAWMAPQDWIDRLRRRGIGFAFEAETGEA